MPFLKFSADNTDKIDFFPVIFLFCDLDCVLAEKIIARKETKAITQFIEDNSIRFNH